MKDHVSEILRRLNLTGEQATQEDKSVAWILYVEFKSRIVTQELPIHSGDEESALASAHQMFQLARETIKSKPGARLVSAVVLYCLNHWMRPFTAKWHKAKLANRLLSSDGSILFRIELGRLRAKLSSLTDYLGQIAGAFPEPSPGDRCSGPQFGKLPFGISNAVAFSAEGGLSADEIARLEREYVLERRKLYHLANHAEGIDAVGLAVSGGGIRSATFSLGLVQVLAKRGVLQGVDFLSTVSGGGYLGSFITTYLDSPCDDERIDLRPHSYPFGGKEGIDLPPVRSLRNHSRYLSEGGASTVLQVVCLLGFNFSAVALLLLPFLFLVAICGGRPAQIETWYTATHCSAVFLAAAVGWHMTNPRQTGLKTGLDLLQLSSLTFGIWALSAPERQFSLFCQILGAVTTVTYTIRASLWCWARRHRLFRDIVDWPRRQKPADFVQVALALLAVLLVTPLLWWLLPVLLHKVNEVVLRLDWSDFLWCFAALFVLRILYQTFVGNRVARDNCDRLFSLAGLLVVCAATASWLSAHPYPVILALASFSRVDYWMLTAATFLFGNYVVNVNSVSLHHFYRDRLARTYLLQARRDSLDESVVVDCRLSAQHKAFDRKLADTNENFVGRKSPYHLINATMNFSNDIPLDSRDRLADFFTFSKYSTGSPSLGYYPTERWEASDPHLDLGTAMAISGAAVSPRSGPSTKAQSSLLKSLLNLRTGYWARVPEVGSTFSIPGLAHYWWESFGLPLGLPSKDRPTFVHLSDGGHLENLGVYELLRRRCKYIIAVDAEADPGRSFYSLLQLTQYASIDFGTKIDVDLDDLKLLNDKYSRSHFALWRIHYPEGEGLFLYIKSSMTGDESEFLRRFQETVPAFPHTPTSQQLYSEAQFEAYRSLGDHVGQRLFREDLGTHVEFSKLRPAQDWMERMALALGI